MAAAVHVRTALTTDAQGIAAVLRQSIAELCLLDHAADAAVLDRWLRNKTPESVTSWLASCATCLVAEGAGSVLGVVMLSGSGQVLLCYVAPEVQGQGVGHLLLTSLEQNAAVAGHRRLTLSGTASAKQFYERHGYRAAGTPAKVFGTLTSFPMEKDIAL
jgi:GNAT superfamily N-acetyltransferase